jgi:hypothetical protein
MAQQLQEQAQSQNGNGQPDPETVSKVQNDSMLTQAKIQNLRESHAARTVTKQIQFEQGLRQKQAQDKLELEKQAASATLDISKERLKHQMNEQKAKKEANKPKTQ